MNLLYKLLDFLGKHIPWLAKKRKKTEDTQPPDTNYPMW